MDQSDFPSATVWSGSAGAGLGASPTPPGYQPLYDLASPEAVTAASFLAGPLAGVWLLARNYRRLGRRGAAWWMLGGGTASVAVVLLAAMTVAHDVPPVAISLPLVLGMWQLARRTQGAAFDEHVARSGPRTGAGTIAIVAVASVAFQVGEVVAIVIAFGRAAP